MLDLSVIGFHKSKKDVTNVRIISQVLVLMGTAFNRMVRAITADDSKSPPHSKCCL